MSEPEFTPAEPTPEESTRRGRPRSQETLSRDESVVAALQTGSRTKEQLADELGIGPNLVYLSLWRLRRAGRVEKITDGDVRHSWRLTG